MKLVRAHVVNYRVHESVEVEFHPATSLLGGQNEAGKSTLVEAIHRAFFLPAKGDTQVHKGMRREGAKDRPEVRVTFDHKGQEWELYKHFGGNTNSTVTLKRSGFPPLEGDEAEAMLNAITGDELEPGKRPNEEVMRKPWGHLWVWQGGAGDNPTDFIQGTTDQLVQLTSRGAGTVTMSDLDSRLATQFQEAHEETYGNSTNAKKASHLGRATGERDRCEEQVAEFERVVKTLGEAADRHADAQARLAKAQPQREDVGAELNTLRREIAAGEVVEIERDRTRSQYEQLHAEAQRLREGAKQLAAWSQTIDSLQAKLSSDEEAQRFEEAFAKTAHDRTVAESRVAEARARKEPLVQQQEKIQARLALLNSAIDLERAEINVARIRRLEAESKAVDEELAGLPDFPQSKIDFYREKDEHIRKQELQLEAVASTLKVLRTRLPLTVNGTPLTEGAQAQLSAETTVAYGDELSLKLVVPGVENEEGLRHKISEQREALRLALAQWIINGRVATSIDQLADAIQQRKAVVKNQAALQRQLKDENATAVNQAFEEAKQAHIRAKANDERQPTLEGWIDPTDKPAAEALSQQISQAYKDQEETIRALDQELRTAETSAKSTLDKQQAYAKTRRAAEDELSNTVSLRQNLLAPHNHNAETFTAALADVETREGTAQRAVAAAEEKVKRLELDRLKIQAKRLADRLTQLQTTVEAARDQLSEARGRLRQEDGSDPDTELREAKERLARACADCAKHQLEADATALLHQLFRDETNAANARITEPLAEAVGGYLRCMFGKDAHVKLRYEDGKFGEFYLVRPGFADHEESFATLSGGAREQVAAAVRLATAEILAADHGGTLPVVFDDAFVNTDPLRIPSVINMLYYAGERGLQVIVSTCDPERYENIGKVSYDIKRGQGASKV